MDFSNSSMLDNPQAQLHKIPTLQGNDCGGAQIAQTIFVGQGKTFTTVQAAIDSIKKNNGQWVKVSIDAGTYKEKVEIEADKQWVFLEGAGQNKTVITYDDSQVQNGSWNATFTISANNVLASGITFKNTYNLEEPPRETTPAVAAQVDGDKCAFFNCGFIGVQDTLLDQEGLHYFQDCYIEGQVDFICGQGQSYYLNCTIKSTRIGATPGVVTAQRRKTAEEKNGYVFEGGSVDGVGQVNLGRPWGAYSRVIFHATNLGASVTPQGWIPWNTDPVGNAFFAEVDCKGPGSDSSKRVPWEKKLTPSDMNQFSLSAFVNQDGWIEKLPCI